MEKTEIRAYLDETRHLKTNDGPMVLGGVWGLCDACISFNKKIKAVKLKNNIPTSQELKWTKVGAKKLGYYKEIIDAFLEDDDINYRGVVINKDFINNEMLGYTDDDFYYRMQYLVVLNIASHRLAKYKLFFDYKDTWSNYKANKTVDYLKKTGRLVNDEFSAQLIQSEESTILQVSDFLNGLVAYANSDSGKQVSSAKKELVRYFAKKIEMDLTKSSSSASEKFNILIWQPKVVL